MSSIVPICRGPKLSQEDFLKLVTTFTPKFPERVRHAIFDDDPKRLEEWYLEFVGRSQYYDMNHLFPIFLKLSVLMESKQVTRWLQSRSIKVNTLNSYELMSKLTEITILYLKETFGTITGFDVANLISVDRFLEHLSFLKNIGDNDDLLGNVNFFRVYKVFETAFEKNLINVDENARAINIKYNKLLLDLLED